MTVDGPLSGVLVIDLSRVLAGPYCTMLMAELGARIIKIEQPGVGDDSRAYGPFVNGKSAYFTSINRGKESIALDLKRPSDRLTFEALVRRADVLIENYRPGTMERLGYGEEAIFALNEQLIYLSASGYGQTGPYSRRPAYDMVVQGAGGIMSVTGEENGRPVRVGISIGDLGAGLYAAIAVNAALFRRERTGQGERIDISMFDCQMALLENAVTRHLVTGEVPGRLGSRHASIAPFQAFKAADGDFIVAAGNDGLWSRLCEVIGRPDLVGDPRFLTNDLRCQNIAVLQEILTAIFVASTVDHWVSRFEAAGIPSGPINTIARAIQHPQVAARQMLADVTDKAMGRLQVVGNPMKFSRYPDSGKRRHAPDLDQDRADILREFGLPSE